MSFTFGGAAGGGNTGTPGFSFGATPKTTAANTAPSGFSFGNAASAAKPAGFSFGTPGTTATSGAPGGFSFGTPAGSAVQAQPQAQPQAQLPAQPQAQLLAQPQPQPPAFGAATSTATAGFKLGATTAATSPSTGFSIGATVKPQSTAAAGFSFGGTTPASAAAPATGLSLGGTTAQTAGFTGLAGTAPPAASGGLTLGGTTPGGFTLGGSKPTGVAAPTTSASTGFALGGGLKLGGSQPITQAASAQPTLPPQLATQKTTASGLTLGSAAAASSAGYKLGGAPTSTSGTLTSGFKLGTTATSTSATSSGLFGTATTTTPATLSTVTSTTASGTTAPSKNYRQLEEDINKWTIELEEQEKIFLQQATQVNAWDRLLIDNGEKITQLNTDVERVKIDQQRLDHELDFILAQQGELEALLGPLEKEVEQLPPINYQQHANPEREHTYQLAENIDAQLKRMVQDLKEIIDHLNIANSSQENTDPVHQIAKILNAHMDSLQWIDQNTSLLQRRVDDVAKQAELRRKEQERNFRLAYD